MYCNCDRIKEAVKLPNFDSFVNVRDDILFRADEPATGSDFQDAIDRAIVKAFHDFSNRNPWIWFQKRPNGVVLTVAPITNRTLTVAAAGSSVAGTLSSAITPSINGYKIRPSGANYHFRVTAHTAGGTAITIDAAPVTLAAGTVITIFQDEYQLAADLGLFSNPMETHDGFSVYQWTLERLLQEYPDPPEQGWPPKAFARLDKRFVRLSSYPDAVHRIEYPYCLAEADPSGTGDLTIDQNFRWVLAEGALYYAYLMKSDRRAATAKQDYERGILEALAYDRKVRHGLGIDAGGPRGRPPYG